MDQATNKQNDTIEAIKNTVAEDPVGGVEIANTPVSSENQEDWNW